MKYLGIYCCGGLGKEICEIAKKINKWKKIIFIDDNIDKRSWRDIEIFKYDYIKSNLKINEIEFVIASGEPKIRKKLLYKLKKDGFRLGRIISKDSIVNETAKIEEGALILSSRITTEVIIGENSLINTRCILSHNVNVGKNVVISPNSNICGNVRIGNSSFIGASCTVRDEVNIGENSILGIGSLAITDIENFSIYYGNPAKKISKNNKERIFSK